MSKMKNKLLVVCLRQFYFPGVSPRFAETLFCWLKGEKILPDMMDICDWSEVCCFIPGVADQSAAENSYDFRMNHNSKHAGCANWKITVYLLQHMQSVQILGQLCHFMSPTKVLRGVTVAENHLFRWWAQYHLSVFLALLSPTILIIHCEEMQQ